MEERRLYGFHLSKKEIKERRKSEKKHKWNEKLDRADLVKLQTELESLNRAAFLTPQQNERKRLVRRMAKDIEERMRETPDGEEKPQLDVSAREVSLSSSSDDYEGMFESPCIEVANNEVFPTRPTQLLPRNLRKRQNTKDLIDGGEKKRAKKAEDALLSNNTLGDNIEDFFDSL